jgi:outer membrane protein TolC
MKHSEKFFMIALAAFLLGGCLTVRLPGIHIQRLSQPEILTWPKLVQKTIRSNPDLQSARYVVTSTARSRDIAFGDYLPSFEGDLQRSVSRNGFSGGGNSASSGSGGGGSALQDNLSLDLVGTQSLFNGFGTTGSFIKARRDLDAAKFQYVVTSANVRNALKLAYIDVLRWNRLWKVNQGILERRKQNAEMVRLRYEAGRENLGSALRAEALAAQAAFDVQAAERYINSQTLRLARESGGEFVLPVTIKDSLEQGVPAAIVMEPDYAEIAENLPQVQRPIKVAEAAKANVVAAQSAVWPQVNGTMDYGSAGERVSNLKSEHSWGLNVIVPFFNGGKNVNAIRKAKADYDAARALAVSARDEAIAQLADAWVKYANAIDNIAVRKKFLEASQKRAEIVRAEYASGLMTFQDFDTAEQEQNNSENDYVQSLADVSNAQANWEMIRGKTLEDDLNANK